MNVHPLCALCKHVGFFEDDNFYCDEDMFPPSIMCFSPRDNSLCGDFYDMHWKEMKPILEDVEDLNKCCWLTKSDYLKLFQKLACDIEQYRQNRNNFLLDFRSYLRTHEIPENTLTCDMQYIKKLNSLLKKPY